MTNFSVQPDLEAVLGSLETALVVGHIASWDLAACDSAEIASEVLARSEWRGYSQIPVRDGGSTIGVLERKGANEASNLVAKAEMRPLTDSILVESTTGILSYVSLAATQTYHLVLREQRAEGIITRSDLLKLPVRIVLFTLLTHLEMTMAHAIRARYPDDSWINLLSKGRRDKLEEEQSNGRTRDLYADRLTFTQWSDKRDILCKLLRTDQISVPNLRKDLKMLQGLRDSVMHANEYLTEAEVLDQAIQRARKWGKVLNQIATGSAATPRAR